MTLLTQIRSSRRVRRRVTWNEKTEKLELEVVEQLFWKWKRMFGMSWQGAELEHLGMMEMRMLATEHRSSLSPSIPSAKTPVEVSLIPTLSSKRAWITVRTGVRIRRQSSEDSAEEAILADCWEAAERGTEQETLSAAEGRGVGLAMWRRTSRRKWYTIKRRSERRDSSRSVSVGNNALFHLFANSEMTSLTKNTVDARMETTNQRLVVRLDHVIHSDVIVSECPLDCPSASTCQYRNFTYEPFCMCNNGKIIEDFSTEECGKSNHF